MATPEKAHYFGFGSNLMLERISIDKEGSPQIVSTGFVRKFKLVFTECNKPEHEHENRWNGAGASLLSTGNESDMVWGVVYSVDLSSVALLDAQESQYARIDVNITLADEKTVMPCFSYVHHALLGDRSVTPPQSLALPSLEYLSVIAYGARQQKLPDWYIKNLEEMPAKPKCNTVVPIFEQLVALSQNKLQLLPR